jgi:membrane-bound metal-dependent hydrolase YbcI (DUF457 family)
MIGAPFLDESVSSMVWLTLSVGSVCVVEYFFVWGTWTLGVSSELGEIVGDGLISEVKIGAFLVAI